MKFDQIKLKTKDVLDSFFDVKGECVYGITSEDTDLLADAIAQSLTKGKVNAN